MSENQSRDITQEVNERRMEDARFEGNQPSKKAKKRKKQPVILPPMVEFTLTLSRVLVLIICLVVLALCIQNGMSPMDILMRVGLAVFISGTMIYFVTWLVVQGVLESNKAEAEKKLKELREASESGAMEFKA